MERGLTVVILTYNSAATVGHCLDGLAAQADPDFDVVVVDDNSDDSTLTIVERYSSRLRIRVVQNGSHCIPRGRNIGLETATTQWVSFIDSDDRPLPNWTHVIVKTFTSRPHLALISGKRLASYRTRTARAIALNDEAIRKLSKGGVLQFAAGNSAINRGAWPNARFDEAFRAAEDLEIVSRISGKYEWSYIPEMGIEHYSRSSLRGYALQMYRYGYMKQMFAYAFGSYRSLDYIPLVLILAGVVSAISLDHWWVAFLVVPFSFLEALFVMIFQRCGPVIGFLSFPAWLVKNLAWSCGVAQSVARLVVDSATRRELRQKRAA